MRTGEQAPPPPGLTALHPLGEKDTISCGNPFDWKFERAAALSRSPGVVLAEILVPDDAGCPFVDAVSDDAGVGRSAPLHPLGDGVREGSHPLALSRGCSVGGFGFRRDRRAAHTFRGCSSAASDFEKMPVAFLWERKRVNRIFSHRDSGAASLSRGTHAQRSSGGRDASEAHTLSLRRTGNL